MTTVDKRERFVRVATARTNKLLHMIELLGNLSRRECYDYSEEDVTKIFAALEGALGESKSKFDTFNKKKFSLFDGKEEEQSCDEQ